MPELHILLIAVGLIFVAHAWYRVWHLNRRIARLTELEQAVPLTPIRTEQHYHAANNMVKSLAALPQMTLDEATYYRKLVRYIEMYEDNLEDISYD